MKKILISLLFVALTLLCLVSCGNETPKSPENSVAGTKIDYVSLSEYTVVFTDGDDISFDAAMKVKTALDEKTASSLRLSTMPESTDTKQIVVGGNDVAASLGVDAKLKYYDYEVKLLDSTIFIFAESAAAAEGATEYFLACLHDDGLEIADYWYYHSYPVESLTLNGIDISEYEIVTEKASLSYANMIYESVLEKAGVQLKVNTEKQGKAIILSSSDEVAFKKCEIKTSDGDILIKGNGINGTYLGALAFCEMLDSAASGGKIEMAFEEKQTIDVAKYTEGLSAYKFFDEEGNLDVNGDGEINIAFIGGSLTQNRTAWTDPVANWFRATFPNKTVKYINAGIGATNSECAAARLETDVFGKITPDVLFVEFAVNDGGFTGRNDAALIKNGAYMESIVKQCAKKENKPVVIFLYAPYGERKGSSTYDSWKNGVNLKGQIADNYGISGVDIWAHFENLYVEQFRENPNRDYKTFLLQYYSESDMLHPTDVGFAIYGDAIVNALSAEPEKFLMNKISAPTYLTKFENITNLTYNLIAPTDTRLTIEGNFKHYKSANAFASGDPRAVTSGKVASNQLAKGVLQIEDGSGKITFESSADVIKLYGIYSSKGMKLDIYSDGQLVGTVDTNANNDYLYIKGVDIPDDGKDSHVITITPSANNGDNYVYRIGYIVEGFIEE